MKLELNVVRFENEDVIATSCGAIVVAGDLSYQLLEGRPGESDHELFAVNGEYRTYFSAGEHALLADGSVIGVSDCADNYGKWFHYDDGEYEIGGVEYDYIECTNPAHHAPDYE